MISLAPVTTRRSTVAAAAKLVQNFTPLKTQVKNLSLSFPSPTCKVFAADQEFGQVFSRKMSRI
jgi:hypothetical protein